MINSLVGAVPAGHTPALGAAIAGWSGPRLLAEVSVSEFVIPRVFVAIAVVIVVARAAGMLARRLRQPPVVGEIIGGILLGPTLLGSLPGHLDKHLFPTEIRPFLTVIANLGLIIFMFIVGLELDLKLIRGKERMAGVISITSIILPMIMGFLLAQAIYGSYAGPGSTGQVERLPFGLFIGSAMSITAFPVLARILVDRGMYRTTLGSLTLACAAVDDILAWALLAVVLAVVKTGTFLSWDFPRIVGLSILFGLVMFLGVRPLLARMVPTYERLGRLTPNLASVVLIGFLLSAFTTAEIGIHHILGAFVFGAVMPREGAHGLTLEILERLEQVSVLLLLPVFFVTTGLGVNVNNLDGKGFLTLLLVVAVACAGKFLGATGAARAQGIGLRRAAAIGTLMNTRGLTELIVLTVGKENGVLNDQLFTIMVVMAVFTTVITEPGLRLFYPDALLARDIADAKRAETEAGEAWRAVVVADDTSAAGPAADLAAALARAEEPAEVVLSRLVPPGPAPELGAGLSAQLLDMTGAMEELAALEERVQESGVPCQVMTRFGNPSLGELGAHVASLGPEVVVLTGHADVAGLARAANVVAGRVSGRGWARTGAGPGPVLVVVADDGDAAGSLVDLGLRLTQPRADGEPAAPLTVAATGRSARRLGRMAELGDPGHPLVRVIDPAEATGERWDVVVTPAGVKPPAPGSVLFEVAVPPSQTVDLDDLRDRWARRMAAEATEPAPAGGTDDEKAGQT